MGVFISSIKPIEKISDLTEYDESLDEYYEQEGNNIIVLENDNVFKNHLKKFTEGTYLVETTDNDNHISMTYSYYNDWRESIVQLIDEKEFDEGYFKEFYWFTDCDGVFDYKVAEKILNDFNKHLSKAEKMLERDYFEYYLDYIKILEDCIENKGVVRYC